MSQNIINDLTDRVSALTTLYNNAERDNRRAERERDELRARLKAVEAERDALAGVLARALLEGV